MCDDSTHTHTGTQTKEKKIVQNEISMQFTLTARA